MATSLHKDLDFGELHKAVNYQYANTGARTGASGFVAADLGKFAWQTDDNTVWMLTATTPTWVEITGSASPTPPTATQVAAGGIITTTSTTKVLVPGMTITPGAGNYLVFFSGSCHASASSVKIEFSVFVNGVEQVNSRRYQVEYVLEHTVVSITGYKVAVGAGQAVEIRWSTASNTATSHERNLTLLKVA